MNILHVTEVIKGGVASHIDELYLLNQKKYKLNFEFYISDIEKKELKNVDSHKIIEFKKTKRSIIFFITYFFRLIFLLIKKKPDIVHCHSTFAGFFVRVFYLLKFWNKPYILYTPHGWSFMMDIPFWKKNFYIFIEKLLSVVTDKIICVSQYEYDHASSLGINSNKMEVVCNGVEDSIININKEEKLFDSKYINCLFVGRLDYQKGIDILLEAFKSVNNNFKLHIIGEKVLNNLNIESNNKCIFHGWVSRTDMDYYYQNTDIVIVPSRWDGLPIVPLEAMKNSKPLIVSDIGPLKEVIKNNGLFFKRNNVNSLAETIYSIPDLDLKDMGANSRLLFEEKFISSKTNKKLFEIYLSVLS